MSMKDYPIKKLEIIIEHSQQFGDSKVASIRMELFKEVKGALIHLETGILPILNEEELYNRDLIAIHLSRAWECLIKRIILKQQPAETQ